MEKLNIFKIFYDWFEGEHREILLAKQISIEEFENDLIKAKDFAESLIGMKIEGYEYLVKGYNVQCLPEYYNQIIWFLTEQEGYNECSVNKYIEYRIDDYSDENKITVSKKICKIETEELSLHK